MTKNIKIRRNRDVLISKMKIVTVSIVALFAVFSCRSTDVEGVADPSGQVAVNVTIEDDIFEQTLNIGNKASAKKSASSAVQVSTASFNEDYYLVAELTEEVPVITQKEMKASLQQINKTSQISDLKLKIKYKIVVYKSTGEYVTEKDYILGQETSAGSLMLNTGSYTFVAYSINSTSSLPAVTFSDVANKTLASSSIGATGSQDLMYFRKDMVISATNANYLGVVLKHKFSQITTTVDATSTGYNITDIISVINAQHKPEATLKLSDGTLTRNGTGTSVAVSFPALGAQGVTATPTLINAAASSTSSYNISSIKIGALIQKNITPFSDLIITPGVKYNMKVKIVPSDAYIIHQGIPAVRINGRIWMRHNLGVNTAVDPDAVNSLIHGNYYQWGRKTSIGNGTSTTVSNWDGYNSPPASAWNSNVENFLAVKTVNDPCPNGFRVPTDVEMYTITSMNDPTHVIPKDVGSSFASPVNYTYAKVYTSIRNSNIKMTLPAQGWYNSNSTEFPYTANSIQSRGEIGYYWTSEPDKNSVTHLKFYPNSNYLMNTFPRNGAGIDKVVGRVIRCIAER